MLKDNEKKRKTNPYSRAYMNSYEWNYMVLELVDYIEEKLSSQGENDDNWKYFKEYCSLKYLNWRVIKKMIEYSVVQVFTSEADLTSYEGFKSLEISTDSISEKTEAPVTQKELDFDLKTSKPLKKNTPKKQEERVEIDFNFEEIPPKKMVNSDDGYNPFSDGAF
jgi:hypothetical protein